MASQVKEFVGFRETGRRKVNSIPSCSTEKILENPEPQGGFRAVQGQMERFKSSTNFKLG